MRSLRDYALLGLLAIVWGVSYNFAKVAVETIPPLTTTAARVAIAAMADRVIRLADGRVTAVEDRTEKLAPAELSW